MYLQIPTTTVRILLNHFKWDKQRLMDRYFSDQKEVMFTEAKVVFPQPQEISSTTNWSAASKSSKIRTFECEICYLTLPQAKMTGLECKHLYCTVCWTDYLSTKILDDGASQSIECPGSACKMLVDDQMVIKLIEDPRTKLKYQQLITNR